MQKRIFGFLFFIVLGMSLVVPPKGDADEWDGNRRRKPAKRDGVAVEMTAISGNIIEVLQNDDTVFLRIGDSSSSQWAAIPYSETSTSQLQVGNMVTLQSGVIMQNYYIKGLKRKFDRVVFSPGIQQLVVNPPEPTYRDQYDRDSYDRDRYNRD